jgi:hypothetical protein
MRRNFDKATAISLVLLTALLLAIVSQNINIATAQTDVATVIVMPTTGGTTDPAPGMYTYNNGTPIAIRAIPDTGFTFSYWLITGNIFPGHTTAQAQSSTIIDPETGQVIETFPRTPSNVAIDSLTFTTNPANITCGYGYSYTYTAVFAAINAPATTPGSSDAVVIVMPTIGGTVTPAAGMYTYPNGTAIVLQANPSPGYVFQYWVVSGASLSGHPTGAPNQAIDPDTGQVVVVPRPVEPKVLTGIDSLTFTTNPTHIICGYGYTYTYTAVFAQQASATSPPTATAQPTATPQPTATATPTALATASPTPGNGANLTIWIIVAVIVIVIIIVVVAAMMRRKK